MAQLRQGVSPQTDELSSTLLGDALDLLAEGKEVNVLLVVQDAKGHVASYEFGDDGPEACLVAARKKVKSLRSHGGEGEEDLGTPVRYALVYDGAVADDEGSFHDALLLEFGERGWQSYSAYCLYEGKGAGDGFGWGDPAPAGEVECLL